MSEFNVDKSKSAQEKYCKETGRPHFAPADGRCYRCNKQIYEQMERKRKNFTGEVIGTYTTGISVEQASTELVTGCPHCNWSYCE